jgi:outer membrane protein TolC
MHRLFINVTLAVLFFVFISPHKQVFAQDAAMPRQPDPVQQADAVVRKLTLDECISLAFQNNPGLQIERERIAELENDYRIAAAALYPRVSLSAYYQQLDSDRIGVLPAMVYSEEALAQARVKQTLFDGGKTRNSRAAALSANEAQKESAEASRLDTVLAVSQAYYRVLESKEILKVSETSREQRAEFFKLTEAFFKAGRATKIELLRAEAQLLDAERSLSQAREARRLSELILKKVIGINLQTAMDIADSLPSELKEPAGEDVLLQEVMMNNPDLKKAGLLKEQSEASLQAAKGPYWPEISLQGTYGYRDRDVTSWDSEWTAGVFLEWALFEGGLTKAQVGKARSRVNQVAWSERAMRDQVQIDLRESLGNLRTAITSVNSTRRMVEAQDEAYQAAVEFYKRGKATYLEVLSAQVDLVQAKVTSVRAVADYQNAGARLDRVVGRSKSYETEKRGIGEGKL